MLRRANFRIDFSAHQNKVMSKKEIKEKYHGMFGVFTHDMYKSNDEDYANGFLGAFEDYGKALKFTNEKGKDTAIHWI